MEVSNAIFKSRIKFAIGKLKIFTPEKEEELRKGLIEVYFAFSFY